MPTNIGEFLLRSHIQPEQKDTLHDQKNNEYDTRQYPALTLSWERLADGREVSRGGHIARYRETVYQGYVIPLTLLNSEGSRLMTRSCNPMVEPSPL